MNSHNKPLLTMLLATTLTFAAGQAFSDSDKPNHHFTGMEIQQALTADQLVQLSSQDKEAIRGSIPVSWYQEGAHMQKQAKISQQAAVAIAVKSGLGKVVKAKLEEEDDYLMWEVKILGAHNERYKLLLDAGTGKALSIKVKGLNHDDEN